jgi:hypothetical protein
MSDLITRIRIALDGIDREESADADGWWETSTGVQFGTERLAAVIAVVAPLVKQLADAEQRMNLLVKRGTPVIDENTSDGFHTREELYEQRSLYNALAFNAFAAAGLYDVHKSSRHSDGEEPFPDDVDDWFIVMATLPTGQISQHYPLKDWDRFHVREQARADEWDGHTPEQANERIRVFIEMQERTV